MAPQMNKAFTSHRILAYESALVVLMRLKFYTKMTLDQQHKHSTVNQPLWTS